MSPQRPPHIPVLLDSVLECLQPEPGKTYVDATLGAGGHAEAILQHIQPGGRLFGIDQDPSALKLAVDRLSPFGSAFQPLAGNFSEIAKLMPSEALPITGGILADIGVSSMQLDQAERGFSFNKQAPLDMRMNPQGALTAATVVNTYSEADLVRLFSEYGEEHMSKTLAREMVSYRKTSPFETTLDLANFIAEQYKRVGKHEKNHPATRVFQALRIEVNDELGSLRRFLESAPSLLAPGATLLVISFHSLEDRIVKDFFKTQSRDCICPPRLPICQCGHRATFKLPKGKLPKGQPFVASPEELKLNPRARSAKLRVAVRI
ncbi:16S rRNA (cytosine(1402)-N(4))-methyltransferase RsmH [Vampirovibrio chlorellavorus]|uniref:16S rRNA (cytosine(1402)-N(4))-methyltransferase RsmH n=1 Tax=Vampirovibrio chlorellavorus TaxID=758823 RepID=UPI0026F0A22A|nr:16S rRNA (cytosine(1402)-N(4))-methyltransferase RsmH [Vampirovibrio chlorellavorus]